MPDAAAFLQDHQGEIVAVVVGLLAALALLALVRKAIALFAVLVVIAALVIAWWLAREQDLLGQAHELLQRLR
ncbi:MAG: hypothetical protein PHU75_01760 [Candidatus Nanopelagicales bacterium]|nr:hypothetical protein [Candidatus Nanopelagicales bacterium]